MCDLATRKGMERIQAHVLADEDGLEGEALVGYVVEQLGRQANACERTVMRECVERLLKSWMPHRMPPVLMPAE